MNITINHPNSNYGSYREACVQSLYNVEDNGFYMDVDLPLHENQWQVGLIVGASGSGKSSIGKRIWGEQYVHNGNSWAKDQPIIDCISPDSNWEDVTSVLSAVGLGSVPAWLRPYHLLSTGEKFRVELARIISESPDKIVIDEFTSVVDRQIAQIGASAFAKAWRRTKGQAVLLSCHYDIIEWLAPDWIFDTGTGKFSWTRGGLRRPEITLDIFQTNWRFWSMFEPHHYLKQPHMVAATCYVGFVGDKPVAHLGVSTRPGLIEARACRLVILPEWQGAGIGLKFLNEICHQWRIGNNRYNKPMRTIFHTSHPGLASALRNSPIWTQISGTLYGGNKLRCHIALEKNRIKRGGKRWEGNGGYGGHFRAVQGFRYLGGEEC